MTKKVIAIDIDDVLSDSSDHVRQIANEHTGLDLQRHHYNIPGPYWTHTREVLKKHGVTDESLGNKIVSDWLSSHGKTTPIEGAISALQELSRNYKIVMITARDPKLKGTTEDWLQKHFAGLYDDLHVIGNFMVVDNPKSKGETCVEAGASWLIDDSQEHCLSAIEHGVEAILYGEYGWHFDAPQHLTRCKNWQAVLEYFSEQPR